MYRIRQFKPTLYFLVLLGIAGFALAISSPMIFAAGWTAVLINAWYVYKGKFRPIPRWVSNVILLVGVPLVLVQGASSEMTDEVVWVGEYIFLLQMVKLYEQRANRDYAQLLVLGLLLMVAAAINTTRLEFGLLLIAYLFLSLYGCLLFYLKSEADYAVQTLSLPDEKISAATLEQDQRHLSRSMRRIAGLVAFAAIISAVVVFLFFPRVSGNGILGGRQIHDQAVTGFNSEVSFQQVANIAQSSEVVAYVKLWKNDVPIEGTTPLLLRGVALERYITDTSEDEFANRWTWKRRGHDQYGVSTDSGGFATLVANPHPEITSYWRQEITLRPSGSPVLFALAGPISIRTDRPARVEFIPATGSLTAPAVILDPFSYDVISTGNLDPPPEAEIRAYLPQRIDPKIESFAKQPEVSGRDARGPLAEQRTAPPGQVDPLDQLIASNIESYLRSHYTYTLDLTDVQMLKDRDPIVAFLYDFKKGHCEYFAGAMTLMCQSLGMQARMVVGYKCDEFSSVGHQYIVRQSNAHSWVEVHTAAGWKTFDPTAGTPADLATHSRSSFWAPLGHLFDYVEYAYASQIVAYDNEDRKNLIESTESAMSHATRSTHSALTNVSEMTATASFWKISTTVIGILAWIAVAGMLVAVGVFLAERWRLRRRAGRIGLDTLPAAKRDLLARQLGFYDELLRVLARHGMVRPPNLTPLEFVESLLFLPNQSYQTILRLTRIFYRIRFGGARIRPGQHRRLQTLLQRLDAALTPGR